MGGTGNRERQSAGRLCVVVDDAARHAAGRSAASGPVAGVSTPSATNGNGVYDAGGMRWLRLAKSGLPRLTQRDGAGQALAEYAVRPSSGGGVTVAAAKECVPGFGGVVAERTWTTSMGTLPKVTFHHRDHLGSLRPVTDPSGTVVEAHDYYPFGGEMGAVGASSRRKFTGHERDEETGLDYMLGCRERRTRAQFQKGSTLSSQRKFGPFP